VRRALRRPTPSRGVLRCRLDVLTTSRVAYEKHHSQYLNTQKTAQTHEKTPSSTRNPARVSRVLRARSKTHLAFPARVCRTPCAPVNTFPILLNAARFPAGANPCDRKPKRTQKQNQSSVHRLSLARVAHRYTIITQLYRIAPLTWLTTHRTITRIRLIFIHRARTPAYDRPSRAHVAYIHTDVQRLSVSQVPPSASSLASCLPSYARVAVKHVRRRSTHTHYTHTRARTTVVGGRRRRRRACGYVVASLGAKARKRKRRFLVPLNDLTNQDPENHRIRGGVRDCGDLVSGDLLY
jgi:hypothetical protein